MRGVVLAGGTGSRLSPLTRVTNKHLLPVGRKPMIFHPIERLLEAGIREILVVTGREHMGAVMELLGSGSEMNADFTFKVQDEAGGIAQALSLAKTFAGGGRIVVILGDNIFTSSIASHVKEYAAQEKGARILLKEVPDPERFGVAELSEDGSRVVGIEEKPKEPKSRLAVTGIYMYDERVFEIAGTLQPSGRGEMEITDVNNAYIQDGEMTWGPVEGEWSDAGTFDSLQRANQILKE